MAQPVGARSPQVALERPALGLLRIGPSFIAAQAIESFKGARNASRSSGRMRTDLPILTELRRPSRIARRIVASETDARKAARSTVRSGRAEAPAEPAIGKMSTADQNQAGVAA